MQSSLQGYAQDLKVKFGLDFKMRIGISSGTVVVGPIGDNLRMDYTSEGDTTNVAARMETMAGPGCILVSQETYRKVAPYFEFRPLGPLAVKGKGGP
jgi:class 3 adenylate cyclase